MKFKSEFLYNNVNNVNNTNNISNFNTSIYNVAFKIDFNYSIFKYIDLKHVDLYPLSIYYINNRLYNSTSSYFRPGFTIGFHYNNSYLRYNYILSRSIPSTNSYTIPIQSFELNLPLNFHKFNIYFIVGNHFTNRLTRYDRNDIIKTKLLSHLDQGGFKIEFQPSINYPIISNISIVNSSNYNIKNIGFNSPTEKNSYKIIDDYFISYNFGINLSTFYNSFNNLYSMDKNIDNFLNTTSYRKLGISLRPVYKMFHILYLKNKDIDYFLNLLSYSNITIGAGILNQRIRKVNETISINKKIGFSLNYTIQIRCIPGKRFYLGYNLVYVPNYLVNYYHNQAYVSPIGNDHYSHSIIIGCRIN